MAKIPVSILLPAEQLEALRALSAQTGAPVNELVRRAIASALAARQATPSPVAP